MHAERAVSVYRSYLSLLLFMYVFGLRPLLLARVKSRLGGAGRRGCVILARMETLTKQIHDVVHAGSSENVLVLVVRDPSPATIDDLVQTARRVQHAQQAIDVSMFATQDDPSRSWFIGQPGEQCMDC